MINNKEVELDQKKIPGGNVTIKSDVWCKTLANINASKDKRFKI